MARIPNLRWSIAGSIAAGTARNYLDRQTFPVVAKVVQNDIDIAGVLYPISFLILLPSAPRVRRLDGVPVQHFQELSCQTNSMTR